MADHAGGSNPSAPVDGGEFLLQLLRQPPQSHGSDPSPQAAAAVPTAASPLPIKGHLHRSHRRYDDPAIAAVGHGIPLSPPNFSDFSRPRTSPWLLPPQHQQQGSGCSPPGYYPPRFCTSRFSPPGYSRPENPQGRGFPRGNRRNLHRQTFQEELQQLGFTGRGPDRNFGSGDRGRIGRSDVSSFPWREQVDVDYVPRKMVVSEPDKRLVIGVVPQVTGYTERVRNSHHSHGERSKNSRPLLGDQQHSDSSARRNMIQNGRPLGSRSRPKVLGHHHRGNAGDGKQNSDHLVVNDEESRNQNSQPPFSHDVKIQKMQRKFADFDLEYGRHAVKNCRTDTSETQVEKHKGEPKGDLHCEITDNDFSKGKEPINEDDLEVESVLLTSTLQNNLRTEQRSNTLTVVEEHAERSEVKANGSRNKDFRSDFSRGQTVSSQRRRMCRGAKACRRDIKGLSPSFFLIYESLVPSEEEVAKQKKLLLLLKELVSKEWPNAELHLYGSCANSFGVSNSDIDVCLAIDDTETSKRKILLRLADILQSDNLQNVQALTHARVPIVKLMDPVTGISCDICVNNLLAVVNTKLLRDYAQIDERLRQLAFLVKHWAKSRDVNETYQGTLSSYAYVLMCIHFLQQRRPAVLPCLQGMQATYVITMDGVECAYFDKVEDLHNFGASNKESVAELLWGFFNYWAFQHNYANDVISIRTGGIISKHSKDWTRRIGNDRHLICIEDPFEVSHDLGRVVDKRSIRILREEFERAADIMQYDSNPCATLFERYIRKTSEEQELVSEV